MANSPVNTNRLYDGGLKFYLGVNSNLDPDNLESSQLSWMVNSINKGGVLDVRPGYQSIFRLPDGKAQGMTSFTPTGGQPTLMAAVGGRIYISEYPFTSISMLQNIQFDPYAEFVVFKECIQAKNLSNVIDPKAIMIMQDGRTKPAYYDGQTDRHLYPGGTTKETNQGLWMEWIGSRLWVARGRQLFASDIFDPLHFTENTYLSIGGSLQAMDGDVITALARTADNRSLLVFTVHNTTIVKAGITDRSTWNITPDFISLLFPGVGCIAGKSITYLNGELWWFSVQGARRFTQVGAAILSSRNTVSSIEMRRSFTNISKNVQYKSCGFSFGEYLGFSVPSGDIFNRHTWVLDTSTNDQLTGDSPPSWQGIWMGTRPVEWNTVNVNGMDRCFYISQDYCGVRIWEAFRPEKTDNGGRIFGSIEYPSLNFNETQSFKRYKYAEFFLTKVFGEVDTWVDYKGDWGCWKRIADLHLCAKDCIDKIDCTNLVPSPSQQNRYFKTQEANHSCESNEGTYSDDISSSFQLRLRWYGRLGVRQYKSVAQQFQEKSTGECSKSDLTCKSLSCCDGEIDYKSHVDDCSYGSGSSAGDCCLI